MIADPRASWLALRVGGLSVLEWLGACVILVAAVGVVAYRKRADARGD